MSRIADALLRVFGWRTMLVHGDPPVLDRWRWLKRHLRGGPLRTLDAGCGNGVFTMYAAGLGNEAVGISLDERSIDIATSRATLLNLPARFVCADLRDLQTLNGALGRFDQIICCEVIEHILSDRKLLSDLSALLEPGGRLLLTTPNPDAKPLVGDRVSQVEDGGHVRAGYTFRQMREMFADCGLSVAHEEFVSGIVSQALANLMRRLNSISALFSWGAVLPFRVLQSIDPPLSRLAARPFLSIAVVGVKDSRDRYAGSRAALRA